MKTLKLFLLLGVAILFATIWSCNLASTTDQANAKDVYSGRLATADILLFSNGETGDTKDALNNGYDTTCMSVNYVINSDSTITKTITFNNCQIGDGNLRNGTIKITFKRGWKKILNQPVVVEFINYQRGGINGTLNGKHTLKLTNLTPITLEVKAENMSLKFDTGEEHTWNGISTIKWLKGFSTPRYHLDDSLLINFNENGYTRKGDSFNAVGTDIVNTNCDGKIKPVDGTIVFTNEDRNRTVTIKFDGCSGLIVNGIRINQ